MTRKPEPLEAPLKCLRTTLQQKPTVDYQTCYVTYQPTQGGAGDCRHVRAADYKVPGPRPRPVHNTPEAFENAPITGHFGFVFEENSGEEIT